MVKILHTADFHLGATVHDGKSKGESIRLREFLTAVDWMIDLAIEEEVDAVLIAGDIFDTHRPDATVQNAFAARVRRLMTAKLPLVMVAGNHDAPASKDNSGLLDIYSRLPLENVWLINRPELITVETKSGPLQILGIPWISRGRFFDAGDRTTELDRKLEDNLDEYITEQIVPSLDPGLPAVVLAHLQITEGILSSEVRLAFGDDPTIPARTLARPQFDYVALGHLHRHQSTDNTPPVVYAGSLPRRDFGDEGVEKGVVIVDINDETTSWRFVQGPARDFYTVNVTIDSEDSIVADIERVLDKSRLTEAIVRLRVSLKREMLPALRKIDLKTIFAGCYRFILEPDIIEEDKIKQGISERLGFEEALGEYLIISPPKDTEPDKIRSIAKDIFADIEGDADASQ